MGSSGRSSARRITLIDRAPLGVATILRGVGLLAAASAVTKAALELATSKLLGRSAYQPPPSELYGGGPTDEDVEAMRRFNGGSLQPLPTTQTRWYLADLEYAERVADSGDISQAARLMRSARRDGRLSGVLSTRTGGLVRLPKRFRGDPELVATFEAGHTDRADDARSVFDEMLPMQELALLAADGVLCGVGVAEFLPVVGRAYPVLCRLDPEFLFYRWNENRWYYRSIAGAIPITPGDGQWVLHTPGGRMSPWQHGLWRCIGRDYIRKEHAQLHKDNYEGKLANPARVAVSPQGAAEDQKQEWWRRVMAWGVNTVFAATPGYDVKLVESNGRGWEAFDTTIAEANTDMIIAIAGQTVTVDGGAGFQNSDIHKTIRADLIKETADGLAYTINTQGIPVYVATVYGVDEVDTRVCVMEWDVTPPKDRNAEAQSLVTTATALTQLTAALTPHDLTVDVEAMVDRFAVPTKPVRELGDTVPPIEPTSSLNGAQVTALLEVITNVTTGQLPKESAIVIIQTAFNLDEAVARNIIEPVEVSPTLEPGDVIDGDVVTDDVPDDADTAFPEDYEVAA